jgi:hypothetical protein
MGNEENKSENLHIRSFKSHKERKRESNVRKTCTKYLLTQWAAVRATWGWMSEAPHWNRLLCVSPSSVSIPLSRASIHGNSPNCVDISSLNIRTHVGFRLPPLTPHEPGGGDSVGPGAGGSVSGTTSCTRTLQHTCTPGHCFSASILCTHNHIIETFGERHGLVSVRRWRYWSRGRWVVIFTSRPLYARGKTPVPTQLEAGWDPEPVWNIWWVDLMRCVTVSLGK